MAKLWDLDLEFPRVGQALWKFGHMDGFTQPFILWFPDGINRFVLRFLIVKPLRIEGFKRIWQVDGGRILRLQVYKVPKIYIGIKVL